MSNLRRFSVIHDHHQEKWNLRNDMTGRVTRSADTKAELTKGGFLERALGSDGGTVRIHKENGMIQEERTFPGSRDPRRSKG